MSTSGEEHTHDTVAEASADAATAERESGQREAARAGEERESAPPADSSCEITVEQLQGELESARAQAAESLDRALRATAELDNYRKRADREIENAHKFALERILNDLLPVKDSLEMGLAAAEAAGQSANVESLREGSELTLKMLSGVLEKSGVSEVDPLHEAFNPDRHQAMSMQDAGDGVESGSIITVIQKGYTLHERLLRPALVIVAK